MQNIMIKRILSLCLIMIFGLSCLSVTADAAGQPTIAVGAAAGEPGKTVQVDVKIENNPGIVALRLFVQYDHNVLKLVKAENGTLFADNVSTFGNNLNAESYAMLWADSTATENMAQDGVLAKLTFEIADTADAGTTQITLTYDAESTFNVDLTNAAFTTQNGSVEIKAKVYTATFMVDGTEYSAKQYRAGTSIEKPADPTKDGYTFKGWSPEIPATMPANDVTFTAVFEKASDPVIKIHNYVASRTVDYRTTITFSADEVKNPVAGAQIHWFIDGQDKGATETCTVKEAKKSFKVQAKYMKGSIVLAESEIETINVKTGFFAKLVAFFRGLFRKLPVIVQEYLGVEIIDRELP